MLIEWLTHTLTSSNAKIAKSILPQALNEFKSKMFSTVAVVNAN